MALRIGITGARRLVAGEVGRLERQVGEVLDVVLGVLAEGDVRAAYTEGAAKVTLLSPLARGADRLVARVALGRGIGLHVPMPFAQGEYERDFTGADRDWEPPLSAAEDLEEFRRLLERAEGRLELDGGREEEGSSYEAVGRHVVRHVDVMVAIWDGGPGNGRGGTAEIVRHAVAGGLPVVWLHATEDRAAVWIADGQDLRDPPARPDAMEKALRRHLRRQMLPPVAVEREGHTWIEVLAHLGQKRHVRAEVAFASEETRKQRWWWGAFHWVMRVKGKWTDRVPQTDPVSVYWRERYRPVNEWAGGYMRRYRSSYVWVFGFAVAALVFGASALLSGEMGWWEWVTLGFAGLELAALLAIGGMVVLPVRYAWHERSIEYRLLAELCRKEEALAPLGFGVATGAARRVAERSGWVAWLFAAWQRAAPLPCGRLEAKRLRHAVDDLIDDQQEYHGDRGRWAGAAAERFARLGARGFGAVLGCVALKVGWEWYHWPHWGALVLGLLAMVLPGVSAALVGIRAYAELQLLVEQSSHTLAELLVAEARVERLGLGRALASQDLGHEATRVATLMLQDLEGWARLFRVKGVEVG